jgi:GTP-binding protein
MAFVDELTLEITAGRGGDGVVRWRTEKFKPLSGPGGGNGGKGGDVFVEAVSDLAYMSHYQFKKVFSAGRGDDGDNFGKQGASGDDLVIKLPVGTVIRQRESGFTWELTSVGQREQLLQGGRGGLGNEWFKSSTNTSPTECTPGADGESGVFEIELHMVADVGLIGLPSAGKSSLLNAYTNAKSKVAAYHFTTLEPHLGVLPSGAIIADIPGLIEGASEGKGLGHKFLRHIKRTRVLVHLVAAINPDPVESYRAIRLELEKYDRTLTEKPEIVVLSQSDEVADPQALARDISASIGVPVYPVSVFDDESLKSLAKVIAEKVGR